jgi:predicted  nucleic acid-binding Zn-ribbon protein
MEYNPYRVELEQLTGEIERARHALDQVSKDCQRYDQYDLAGVQSKAEAARQVLPKRAAKVEDLTRRVQSAHAAITALSDRSSIGINPLFWFSDERKRLLQQRDEAVRVGAGLIQEMKDAKTSLEKAQEFSKQVSDSIEWYAAFDRTAADARKQALERRIAEIDAALPALRKKSAALDSELAPLLLDLNVQESRRTAAESRMTSAERYDRRLNSAANSYEKRMVHEACRAELGNGSPSQVIERSRRDKESAERSIGKIKKHLEQVAQRQSRRIDRLVFDGKNLCHDRQGAFIGLGPLKAIMGALQTEAKKIFVFDESIRTRHGFDERQIRDVLGTGVTVHIVNGTADETVLNLAPDDHDYVVSNDRFVEYRSKAAVRKRRIFPHEIVDNRVMIKDLGVSASFA